MSLSLLVMFNKLGKISGNFLLVLNFWKIYIKDCMFVCVGVVPDDDMGYKLIRIFGQESHAFRKYQRMMYWMPKFKFANPYYVPYVLPNDDIELAKMALNRMSVDLENKITVHHVSDVTLFSH